MARSKKIEVKFKDGTPMKMDDSGFARFFATNSEAAANHGAARSILSQSINRLAWRGDSAVPPGSPAADILEAFRKHTNMPLELPWACFLFYLSTYLHNEGVRLKIKTPSGGGFNVTPEVWSVALAPSGSGKSFALRHVSHGAPFGETISGIASGAALISEMAKNEDAGKANAMLVDEFAQPLKAMEEKNSHLADAKKYLLLAYDGGKIDRTTKAETIILENSRMPFLGLNVDETFFLALSFESLLDGFAQRFIYFIAKPDPDRPFYDYPFYDEDSLRAASEGAWARILATPLHDEYTYSAGALEAYSEEFRALGKLMHDDGLVNASFFRRIMQATHKFALLMHIIMGDGSAEVSKMAMGYAIRQTRLNLIDAATLIAAKSPKATEIMTSIDDLAERLAAKGESLTPRTIRQYVRDARDEPGLAETLMAAHANGRGQTASPRRRGRPTKAEAAAKKAAAGGSVSD